MHEKVDHTLHNMTNATGALIMLIIAALGLFTAITGLFKYLEAQDIFSSYKYLSQNTDSISEVVYNRRLGIILIILGLVIFLAGCFAALYLRNIFQSHAPSTSTFKTVICHNCGLPVTATVKNCPRCGEEMPVIITEPEPRLKSEIPPSKSSVDSEVKGTPTSNEDYNFCVNCGHQVNSGDHFCIKCGKKL